MVIIAVAPRYYHSTPPIVLLRISAVGRPFIICHLLQLAASLHHRRSVAASSSYITHSHFPPNIVHTWQHGQRSKVPPAKYWPCSLAQTIATDLPAVVDRDAAPCHLITLQKGCCSGRVIWFVSGSAWAPTHFGPSGGDGLPLHLVAARTRSAPELGRTRFRRLLGAHFNRLSGHCKRRHTDEQTVEQTLEQAVEQTVEQTVKQTAELALETARGAPRQLHRLLLEGGWLC